MDWDKKIVFLGFDIFWTPRKLLLPNTIKELFTIAKKS